MKAPDSFFMQRRMAMLDDLIAGGMKAEKAIDMLDNKEKGFKSDDREWAYYWKTGGKY